MVNKKRNLKAIYSNKRGQVTIFIIIAILIVIGGVLVYMFTPEFGAPEEKRDIEDPQQYIQGCVSDRLEEVTRQVSLNGGSLEPEASFPYQGNNLEYLCYSNENYDLCSVQRPFLRTHIEEEIKSGISGQVESCFSSLEEEYGNKGYSVYIEDKETNVELLPERVQANLNKTVNLQQEQNTETHKNFRVNFRSNLYDLVNVAESIVEWEAKFGSAEPALYMNVYHNLLVEKRPQSDETTIYIIENLETGNKFQFASRSLAFPAGYGAPSKDVMKLSLSLLFLPQEQEISLKVQFVVNS